MLKSFRVHKVILEMSKYIVIFKIFYQYFFIIKLGSIEIPLQLQNHVNQTPRYTKLKHPKIIFPDKIKQTILIGSISNTGRKT